MLMENGRMDVKETLVESVFQDQVKKKHLQEFTETTPKGHVIKGYICRKANIYLGSLAITHIDDKELSEAQFVQSMPKIHYLDSHKQISEDVEEIYGYEKLDGTCIIIYPLFDYDGNLIELVPKTRGKAVADSHILEMWNQMDHYDIEQFYQTESSTVLMFEMYGVLNRHSITYINTYIDAKLIGVYEGALMDGSLLDEFAKIHHFKRPELLYTITKDKLNGVYEVNINKETHTSIYTTGKGQAPLISDAVSWIKDDLSHINNQYKERTNRNLTEGVVLNTLSPLGRQKYIKIKPHEIEEQAKQVNGIPRRILIKEVYKFFDEYSLDTILEEYKKDKTFYENQINDWLLEEYKKEMVYDSRTKTRLEKVFIDVWNSKLPTKSQQNLAEELVNNNPNGTISELMRKFGEQYPQKKKEARKIYQILESMGVKK